VSCSGLLHLAPDWLLSLGGPRVGSAGSAASAATPTVDKAALNRAGGSRSGTPAPAAATEPQQPAAAGEPGAQGQDGSAAEDAADGGNVVEPSSAGGSEGDDAAADAEQQPAAARSRLSDAYERARAARRQRRGYGVEGDGDAAGGGLGGLLLTGRLGAAAGDAWEAALPALAAAGSSLADACHAVVSGGLQALGVRAAAGFTRDDSLLLLVSVALALVLLLRSARRNAAAARAALAALQPAQPAR
jgi:hypothetical protein